MEPADWFALGAAVFTAVAGTASAISVWQARKALNAGTRPAITISPLIVPDPENPLLPRTLHMEYVIHNSGALAQGVGFLFVSGGRYVEGLVGTGIMRTGDTVTVISDLEPDDERIIVGVVMARDMMQRSMTWDGRHRRPKRRKPGRTLHQLFAMWHPRVDLSSMQEAAHRVDWRDTPL
jgi:hypothetical protein